MGVVFDSGSKVLVSSFVSVGGIVSVGRGVSVDSADIERSSSVGASVASGDENHEHALNNKRKQIQGMNTLLNVISPLQQ